MGKVTKKQLAKIVGFVENPKIGHGAQGMIGSRMMQKGWVTLIGRWIDTWEIEKILGNNAQKDYWGYLKKPIILATLKRCGGEVSVESRLCQEQARYERWLKEILGNKERRWDET